MAWHGMENEMRLWTGSYPPQSLSQMRNLRKKIVARILKWYNFHQKKIEIIFLFKRVNSLHLMRLNNIPSKISHRQK